MNTSIQRNTSDGKSSWWILACVFVLALAAFSFWSPLKASWSVATADELMEAADLSYYSGTFSESVSNLTRYIQYIEAHTDELTRRGRNVTQMLYLAHANLAYMFLCTDDSEQASDQIRKAYSHYLTLMSEDGLESIQRSEFVGFILDSEDRLDQMMGNRIAGWKAQYSPNPSTVAKVETSTSRLE